MQRDQGCRLITFPVASFARSGLPVGFCGARKQFSSTVRPEATVFSEKRLRGVETPADDVSAHALQDGIPSAVTNDLAGIGAGTQRVFSKGEAGRESAPIDAEMGISGANIAVAETGSIVILTNEGNARLVTTLPKLHVAIIGIEKLVARWRTTPGSDRRFNACAALHA